MTFSASIRRRDFASDASQPSSNRTISSMPLNDDMIRDVASHPRSDRVFGRDKTILLERERIKRLTIQNRRSIHRRKTA